MEELALLGGKPIRKKPFASNVIVDADERREIGEVLRRKEFSRFMGSPTPDIQDVLQLPSAKAVDYNPQYFTFLGGRKVRQLERDFAAKFGAKYAITVNSATSGLSSAVGALGVEPGDEILITAMSFHASAAALLAFNAVPVFVDVSTKNFCIDPGRLEAKITPRTKAILVVHLLGMPADMDAILAIARKHKLKVIEDCAQSPGTKYKGKHVGTIADVGVFSLQETKNITTGEGGVILTSDPKIAARCRLIRNHGESIPDETWSQEALSNCVGFNFRMTELTAALGIAQLRKLDKNNAQRERNAAFLRKALAPLRGLKQVEPPEGTICHVLPMLYDERETGVPRVNIVHALRAEGIPIGTGYSKTMYEHPMFLKRVAFGSKGFPFTLHGSNGQSQRYQKGDCPVAEDLLKRRFVWFYHVNRPNTEKDMKDVATAFAKVWENLGEIKDWDPAGKKLAYKW